MNYKALLKLLRPKDWIKNTIVFMPLIFSASFLQVDAILHACYAFFLFNLAASATYITNDLHDIEQDRLHPLKSKSRPLANGLVSNQAALILLSLLLILIVVSCFYMPRLTLPIGFYLVLNLFYTFIFKQQPIIDLFCIAIGFVLRIYAGGIAIQVPISGWMLITSLMLAIYLAAIKRKQELVQHHTVSRKVLKKYSLTLIKQYADFSSISAVLFYSMYVMSSKPELILTIPIILFGLFRYNYIVEQHQVGESPTDALFSDWQLGFTVLLWMAACIWMLWP